MKRALICLVTLVALTLPRLADAQFTSDDDNGPPPYNDVEDGQALRIAGYILAPFGYALEWTVTRPLHYVATDTAAKPVLSGDTDIKYFGETSNSDYLPPATFAPFKMPANPNAMVPDGNTTANYEQRNGLPPVRPNQAAPPSAPASGGQPALH
jgi:hypothetical protein